MKKRVFIIHGWGGFPEEGWFPWLKRELEARGFTVSVPQLPVPGTPRIGPWVSTLADAVGSPDAQTFFVGHSMGCQAIARFVEALPDGTTVGGAVFVAGFFRRLTGIGDGADDRETVRHWLQAPLDLSRVRTRLGKSIAIFSDTDPFVPLDNQEDFRDALWAEIVVEHGQGHFSGPSDGVTELPVALSALLRISG